MTIRTNYDERIRVLRAGKARELLAQLINLRRQMLNSGAYTDAALAELATILKTIRNDFTGNDQILSSKIEMSAGSIARFYQGRSQPRFHNFMRMLNGSIEICEQEAAKYPSELIDEAVVSQDFREEWLADWVHVARTTTQGKISTLAEILDELILLARGSNQAIENSVVTEIEKNQLVSILETALAMLRSPMVEKGFLRKLRNKLFGIAAKSADHQIDRALGAAAEHGGDLLNQFLDSIG